MKKTTLFFAALLGIPVLLLFSFIKKPVSFNSVKVEKKVIVNNAIAAEEANIHNHAAELSTFSTTVYRRLSLNDRGLSKKAFNYAVKGYLHLQEQGKLKNEDLLTIVDFSQSSRKKRFYLMDMKHGKLLQNTYVAHAKNSGVDKANSFSNIVGAEKSSLGFYVTKGTYTGKHGLSLRMEGLDKGFNDNAEKRAVVVHGADYVNAGRVLSAYMGRSQGCPAVPMEDYIQIINRIKGGSTLFIYYPSADYLQNSTVLNS